MIIVDLEWLLDANLLIWDGGDATQLQLLLFDPRGKKPGEAGGDNNRGNDK